MPVFCAGVALTPLSTWSRKITYFKSDITFGEVCIAPPLPGVMHQIHVNDRPVY